MTSSRRPLSSGCEPAAGAFPRRPALILAAAALMSSCGGDGGDRDASTDGADAADGRSEMCIAHPNSCVSGGSTIPAYDCCSPPKVCCDLCFPPERCGSKAECLESCPGTIPCEGIPGQDNLSCYYDPSTMEGTAYCPVHQSPGAAAPVACVAECPTGVTCPLPADPYGDTALCCPEGTVCATVPLYGLPRCDTP